MRQYHACASLFGLLSLTGCSLLSLDELSDGEGAGGLTATSAGGSGNVGATNGAGASGGSGASDGGGSGGSGIGGADGGSGGASGGSGGAGGSANPCGTTGILDNFDRADGPLGASWSMARDFVIEGDRVRNIRGTGGYLTLWNGSFAARQEAHIVLSLIDRIAEEQFIALKAEGSSRRIEIIYSPSRTALEVWTCNPGCTLREAVDANAVSGSVLYARTTETGAVTVCLDGVERLTATLTGWPFNGSTGQIGFGKLQNDLTQPMAFDDFGGGSLP